MRLLDRYLLRELLVPLAYCLVGFLIFWIAFDLFAELHELQEHKLRALDVVQYYLIKTPEFLIVVLPIALLLALLYTLTNHARHHEITAIRAAGVSLWRLCLPYFGIGLLASVAVFALNEFFAPDATEAAERVLNRRVQRKSTVSDRDEVRNLGFTNTRDGRAWQIGSYNIRTGEMRDPKVLWPLPDGSYRWLHAERAVRSNGVWTFFNAREFTEEPATNSYPVPSLQTNVLAMPEFTETPEEIKSEIKIGKRLTLLKSVRRGADIPLLEIVDYLRLHPRVPRDDRFWLYTKLHGRLAAPWTCLVVVLIAIPFGAASGRRNIFVGVASSILICFAYFILLQLGMALGMGGRLPAWLAAWLPNLSFGSIGLFLMARVR
jgi:lipopolysaccharide export system permease protein